MPTQRRFHRAELRPGPLSGPSPQKSGLPKCLIVSHAVGQREQEPVVGHAWIFERTAHPEVEPVADEHERDVVEGVGVALAELWSRQDSVLSSRLPPPGSGVSASRLAR